MIEMDKQTVAAILRKIEHEAADDEWASAAAQAVKLLEQNEYDIVTLTSELNAARRQIREDDEMIHTLLGVADGLTQVLERIVTES